MSERMGMTGASAVRAARGYRGARLGPPYEYRWVDQHPSGKTWADLAERRGCFAAIGAACVIVAMGVVGGGMNFGWVIAAWAISGGLAALAYDVAKSQVRQDGDAVPKPVQREAWIEFADGDFFFALAVNGTPEIFQPWALVRQFEKVDYWSMFGDGGASPIKNRPDYPDRSAVCHD